MGRPIPSLAEYYRGGLRIHAEPGTRFAVQQPRARHARPDRRGRERDAVGPLPSRARLRAARHGRHRPGPVRAGPVAAGDRVRAALRRRRAGHRPRDGDGRRRRRSTPAPGTWPATSLRSSAAAPTSTARCSSPRRWPPCSSPTTSPIRGYPGMGLAFFRGDAGGHSRGRAPGHPARASTRRSSWPRTTESASWPSPTGPAGRCSGCRPRCPACSIDLLGVPDDAIRTDVPQHPETGATSAAGTTFPAGSPMRGSGA